MSFLFASSHLPETRVQRPDHLEEEEDGMQPPPRAGMVRAFSHLPAKEETADPAGLLSQRGTQALGRPFQPPPPRQPGMINDGQGFKPAAEFNAGLRSAQPIAPPTAPATPSKPNSMANWTPEEEKAALAAARARSTPPPPDKMPQIPSPAPGLDMESINLQRTKWERQQRLNPNQKLNAEGNPDSNGFSNFDEAAKSLYGDAYAPSGKNIITLGPDGKLKETPMPKKAETPDEVYQREYLASFQAGDRAAIRKAQEAAYAKYGAATKLPEQMAPTPKKAETPDEAYQREYLASFQAGDRAAIRKAQEAAYAKYGAATKLPEQITGQSSSRRR